MEKQEPTQNEVEAWGKIWDTHWIPIDNNKFIHYAIDITEHKRAREALYESEDRFRDLAELLPETIFITDKEGTITFVNQAGREKFGYTEKDFKKGINVLHALVPKDRDRAQENIAMLTYDKAGQGTEYTALRKDGSTFPVIVYANPVTRDGKLAGMRGILVDNSERKRVEMGLKWESDINRALVELSSTIELTQTPIENVAEIVLWYSISLTNSEFGIVSEIDPKTGEIIGYKPKMMNIGSASKQFKKATFPKGPDGKYIGLWGEAFRIQKGFYTNSPKTHEATRKFPEMHLHLNNFLSVPVIVADKVVGQIAIANSANEYTEKDLNAVKQIAYLYAVAIDRNRSESALRESEENLAKAQEIAHVGSWDWDIATNKLHWSDEMYRIFDIKSTSEPTLEMVQERIHPEDRKIFKKAMTKPKKSKSPESIEHRIIKSNGKVRSLQTRSELFFNNHGDIIRMMGTMQDITELKHVEEQLERALSEETLLFRELKHRVNNNLQLLISMVNMWVMETEVAAVREALSEVAGVISTMALVHTEAQVDPSAKGIRLKEFMRELTKSIIGFKTHGNLEVTYSIDGDDVWIEIEQANPLSLVANEILINALKHAFNRKKKGHIAVSLKENDGKVKLSIKDDGIGISPEVDIMKGDSLGMELVQNLVEQLHGNMNIEVDNGTNIIIEFPKGG